MLSPGTHGLSVRQSQRDDLEIAHRTLHGSVAYSGMLHGADEVARAELSIPDENTSPPALAHRARSAIVQVRERSIAGKHVILYLAANPALTSRLALDREARAIHVELKRSGFRDRFAFETRWAAEPLDLLRELRELQPTVLHFSGHGHVREASGRSGRDVVLDLHDASAQPARLVFHGPNGGPSQLISPDALAHAIAAVGSSVQLVVLSACFSESIADALLNYVKCVVGISGAIHDDAARSFAIGFYGGLGDHASVAAAYAQGKAAIELDGLPDAERPQLKVRAGFAASELILAAAAPTVRRDLPCPYPGMRPYAANDAARFYGRDAEINEIVGRLRAGDRAIYVIGPSGSGKSSLVNAGVLPRLARGVAGLQDFVVRTLRPGDAPIARLAQALEVAPDQPDWHARELVAAVLAPRSSDTALLLVVDQLEELFTLTSARERERFLDAVRELRSELRCTMIFTLRADFYGALMASRLWTEHHGQLSRVDIGLPGSDALRAAIVAPADDVGVMVEPALVERLLADAAGEPGMLPLLQEALVQLWDARIDQTLTLAGYLALGDGVRSGLAVAIARRADATLRRLSPEQVAIARRILLRLISFGEGRSDTRRQQQYAQLRSVTDDAAEFDLVLHQLIADRLLAISDDEYDTRAEIDLAHEVMIGAWPTLAGWITSHRIDEQRRRKLEAAAADWIQYGRGARGLLDPIELADAQQQTEPVRALGYHTDVTAFIAASRAAHNQQRRRRNYVLAGTLTVLAGFVVVVSILAIAARAKAESNRRLLARSYEEQGRQLLLHDLPLEAIPYFLAALENGEEDPSLRTMFAAATRDRALFPSHGRPISSAAFLNGSVSTTSLNGDLDEWDAETGKHLSGRKCVLSSRAVLSSDGFGVLLIQADGTVQMCDPATQQMLPAVQPKSWPEMAWFSASASRVLLEPTDGSWEVWDLRIGKMIRELPRPTDDKRSNVVAFSPNGTRVAIKQWPGNVVQVWNANDHKPVTKPIKFKHGIASAAFSSDDRRFAIAAVDGHVWVWNLEADELVTASITHADTVFTAAFNRDGSEIVTASADRTAQVWDAKTGEPKTPPLHHAIAVERAIFSPDGKRVATISGKTVRVWNAATGKQITDPHTHHDVPIQEGDDAAPGAMDTAGQDQTRSQEDTSPDELPNGLRYAVLSPDASHVLVQNAHGKTRVWDTNIGKPTTELFKLHDKIQGAAFNAKGTFIVTVSQGAARVWNAATGGEPIAMWPPSPPLAAAALDPDGTNVIGVTAGSAVVRRWDRLTNDVVNVPLPQGSTRIALGLDGVHVATANAQVVKVLDLALPGYEILLSGQPALPRTLAFSDDGTQMVTAASGNADKSVRIWDARGALVSAPLEHPEPLKAAVFSHDGRRVLTTSQDNSARVWSVATGKPITRPLEHRYLLMSAMFSHDDTQVITVTRDAIVHIWDISPDNGSPEQWADTARCSPFVLSKGVLQERTDATEPGPCASLR